MFVVLLFSRPIANAAIDVPEGIVTPGVPTWSLIHEEANIGVKDAERVLRTEIPSHARIEATEWEYSETARWIAVGKACCIWGVKATHHGHYSDTRVGIASGISSGWSQPCTVSLNQPMPCPS